MSTRKEKAKTDKMIELLQAEAMMATDRPDPDALRSERQQQESERQSQFLREHYEFFRDGIANFLKTTFTDLVAQRLRETDPHFSVVVELPDFFTVDKYHHFSVQCQVLWTSHVGSSDYHFTKQEHQIDILIWCTRDNSDNMQWRLSSIDTDTQYNMGVRIWQDKRSPVIELHKPIEFISLLGRKPIPELPSCETYHLELERIKREVLTLIHDYLIIKDRQWVIRPRRLWNLR